MRWALSMLSRIACSRTSMADFCSFTKSSNCCRISRQTGVSFLLRRVFASSMLACLTKSRISACSPFCCSRSAAVLATASACLPPFFSKAWVSTSNLSMLPLALSKFS